MKSSLYLRSLERLRECAPGYPGDTAVLRRFSRLDFSAPVTMLCGDNGCGKTTLIELLACKVRANRIGPPQGALTGSQRAVNSACSACFRLHFNDLDFFTEDIGSVLGNPFIHVFCHR